MVEMDPEGVLVELGEEDTIAKGAHASDTNAYERVCVSERNWTVGPTSPCGEPSLKQYYPLGPT